MSKFLLVHKEGGYLFYDSVKRNWERTYKIGCAAKLPYERAQEVLYGGISPAQCRYWSVVDADSICARVPERPAPADEEAVFDWQALCEQQRALFHDLPAYRKQLGDDLHQVELEICDIQHYIEFYALDAAKGYKAYRMLKDRLARRRRIKDEIAKSTVFIEATREDFATGRVNNQLRGFDERRYTPRVLDELFGLEASA